MFWPTHVGHSHALLAFMGECLLLKDRLSGCSSVTQSCLMLCDPPPQPPTPWTAAHQASLSFIISWSLFKVMSIELVMPSNHLILCHPLLLLPSILPSIRVFSNESDL